MEKEDIPYISPEELETNQKKPYKKPRKPRKRKVHTDGVDSNDVREGV